MKTSPHIPEGLSYCGIYCEACPALLRQKTCLGCRSEDRNQKRTSKWSCRIRKCCIEEKQVNHCGECEELVCKTFKTKMLSRHRDDIRHSYHFETLENFEIIREFGNERFKEIMLNKHQCPACGGVVSFYEGICMHCDGWEDRS